MTFVGRAPNALRADSRRRPVDSNAVAVSSGAGRVHRPERDDPCSNALLEALACGLPAAYRDSGGHPELVGEGGLPFARGGSSATCSNASSPDRRAPGGDHGSVDRVRSPTRISTCSALGERSLESPQPCRTTSAARTRRPLPHRQRLDRAAVDRAHDVLYLSDSWTQATWLGAQALKNPSTSGSTRRSWSRRSPELIVETGTYRGGSAFYLASICDLLGSGEVSRSTWSPSATTTRRTRASPTSAVGRRPIPRSSTRCADARRGQRTLVILDSDHSQAHVEAELAAYAPLVPVGCYLIVEDSNIGQIRKDLMPGPLEAIETFLAVNDEFEIDRSRERFLITFNPSGYLRRVR